MAVARGVPKWGCDHEAKLPSETEFVQVKYLLKAQGLVWMDGADIVPRDLKIKCFEPVYSP